MSTYAVTISFILRADDDLDATSEANSIIDLVVTEGNELRTGSVIDIELLEEEDQDEDDRLYPEDDE